MVAQRAGVRPNLLEYFAKWNEGYRRDAVDAAYQQGAVPLLTWEPWGSVAAGTEQPQYALAEISNGRHDAYIRRFAQDVKAHGRPVIVRFAHEMNGTWFPWAERRNGNSAGEYVEAWRHVHDIFTEAGVRNVAWQWSPNILRTVEKVRLQPLYPGDEYVDIIGLSGYSKHEVRAADVFEPALEEMQAFTRRPVLIAETGARPGDDKALWIADFFTWLRGRPDVIGFVWFERSVEQGASTTGVSRRRPRRRTPSARGSPAWSLRTLRAASRFRRAERPRDRSRLRRCASPAPSGGGEGVSWTGRRSTRGRFR